VSDRRVTLEPVESPPQGAEEREDEVVAPELPRAVICLGASAGGIEPLRSFVAALHDDVPAAVLVVVHFPPAGESALDKIIGRVSPLTALRPADRERLVAGRVYVAPPDHHLLIADGVMRITRGPRENALRPAIDPLFRSAARAFGDHAIAVVLSGTGSDGAAGAAEIRARGGKVLVQDPIEALYPVMPQHTIDIVEPDAVLGAADLGRFAASLAEDASEMRPALVSEEAATDGRPSGFSCPECGGALWEHGAGATGRFVCRIGHAYVPETLMSQYDKNLEDVLWSSIRALEERAELSERLAERMTARGSRRSAQRFRDRMQESRSHADALRGLLLHGSMEAAAEER
jgi:two-component system chemotaxis response regulator CheB